MYFQIHAKSLLMCLLTFDVSSINNLSSYEEQFIGFILNYISFYYLFNIVQFGFNSGIAIFKGLRGRGKYVL